MSEEAAAISQELIIYRAPEERAEVVPLIEAATVLLEKAKKYIGLVIQTDSDAALVGELRARMNDQANKLDAERLELTATARALVKTLNDAMNDKYIKPLQADVKTLDASISSFFAKKEAEAAAAAAKQAEIERAARDAAEKAEAERRKAEADRIAAEQLATEATDDQAKADAQEMIREAAQRAHNASVDVAAHNHAIEAAASLPAPEPAQKSMIGVAGSRVGMRDCWIAEVTDPMKVPEAYLIPPIDRVDMKVLNALAKSRKDAAAAPPGVVFKNKPTPTSRVSR